MQRTYSRERRFRRFVKELFDHVRNLGLCAMLFAAGVYALDHPGPSTLGRLYEDAPGWTVIGVAAVLGLLNLWDWALRLRAAGVHSLWLSFIMLLYVLIAVRIIELVLAMRLAL